MIKDDSALVKYNERLCVLVMPRTRFRVNPYSIVA